MAQHLGRRRVPKDVCAFGRRHDLDATRAAGFTEARVGTVDRFQGQEAPVVLVTMTSSTAVDLPRGLDFLLSRNRLNVALSRAQALALLICSPRLVQADIRDVEQMRLIKPDRFASAWVAR